MAAMTRPCAKVKLRSRATPPSGGAELHPSCRSIDRLDLIASGSLIGRRHALEGRFPAFCPRLGVDGTDGGF